MKPAIVSLILATEAFFMLLIARFLQQAYLHAIDAGIKYSDAGWMLLNNRWLFIIALTIIILASAIVDYKRQQAFPSASLVAACFILFAAFGSLLIVLEPSFPYKRTLDRSGIFYP